MTNPVHLRHLARSLDASADSLPQADALRCGTDISPDLDGAMANISWTLGTITNDLAVSYSRETKRPLPRNGALHATAISGCAAPLGNAVKHLGTAVDRLSSHHHILRPATATPIHAPEDLLVPLQRDISRARTAIRRAAKQLRENAALLHTATTPSHAVSDTASPSAVPRSGRAR
ncbi:hypothetical protein NLX86_25890 [Streptomyces sp. A3M-1-3]|uniref:hypothetical protein n=1 Tax=Streptomyces sp. A3M-1-3 TaxID=2962044 RepID=UPI0020B66DED|nr:hypothetical protein [Streptomyces sp. A3M-1-3]MCP3821402.1 hypothetical protein [Streptomyces sp. A3M-1-3]